ncbi:MAG: glycosyltransferase family 2 protein [Pseudomonadota bacterium]
MAWFSLRRDMKVVNRHAVRVHGTGDMPATGVIGFVLLRDGEVWLEEFLHHHFNLGVSHMVLMDNGSTDNTVALACQHPNTTVLTCDLDFRDYQHAMRLWMQYHYGHDRWSLMLDVDEFFDYPGSQEVGLGALTGYLDANGFDAVFATMLDMYPESIPLAGHKLDLQEIRYFETASITRTSYNTMGVTCDRSIVHGSQGGVRGRVFGLQEVQLVKHPLRKDRGHIRYPMNSHFIYGVSLADFSTVLRHYKYVPGFEDHVSDSVRKQQYWRGSYEYRHYQAHLTKSGRINLKDETSEVFLSADQLLEQGFLNASAKFKRFLNSPGSTPEPAAVKSQTGAAGK